jgi:hypothetical protein
MRKAGFLALLLLAEPILAFGCSAQGFQVQSVRSDFVVVVNHRNKPVPDAEIAVTPSPGTSAFLTEISDEKGTAEVRSLPTGRYWLIASY